MDIATLRSRLEGVLVALVGIYTLANGETTPAVSVRGKGEPMTAGTNVTGLEVVIQRDPEGLERVDQYDDMEQLPTWVIWLAEWGQASASAAAAAALIVAAIPGAAASPVPLSTGGPLNMVRVDVRDEITTPPEDFIFDGNGSIIILDGNQPVTAPYQFVFNGGS